MALGTHTEGAGSRVWSEVRKERMPLIEFLFSKVDLSLKLTPSPFSPSQHMFPAEESCAGLAPRVSINHTPLASRCL